MVQPHCCQQPQGHVLSASSPQGAAVMPGKDFDCPCLRLMPTPWAGQRYQRNMCRLLGPGCGSALGGGGVDSVSGPTAAMVTAGLRTEAGNWRREMIGKKWRNFQRDGGGQVGP